MAQVKRETAIICMIDNILNGNFVKTEGWNPSYFETDVGNVSRANIMGVVVSKDQEGLVVDDGSGRILLRSFEDNSFFGFDIGNFVMVIGRPRIYNNQKYITPEIIKRIDPLWGEFRKAQLEGVGGCKPMEGVEKKPGKVMLKEDEVEGDPGLTNPFQKIMEFIKDLDSGGGADIDEVVKRSGFANADETVRRLIAEGEIFEIRPGKLKILE